MAKIFLVCMLAVSGLLSSLADEDVNEGDMNVKVLGQSGKISLKHKSKFFYVTRVSVYARLIYAFKKFCPCPDNQLPFHPKFLDVSPNPWWFAQSEMTQITSFVLFVN